MPPSTQIRQRRWAASAGSVESAASSGSGWSSPGSTASAMPRSRQARGELLDAVGPVAPPAEQPHDHQRARGTSTLLDIEVDREVVAERAAGWRGAGWAPPSPSRACAAARQASSVSAAERIDDLARRLAEIDGLAAVGDRSRLGGEEMHGCSRRRPAIAARDRGAVEALEADHHQPAGPRLAAAPRRGRSSAAARLPTPCSTRRIALPRRRGSPSPAGCRGPRRSP